PGPPRMSHCRRRRFERKMTMSDLQHRSPKNGATRLEARNISHSYATGREVTEVLRNLSFHLDENELISFVGPSGCGKSTLFNIIAGLITPSSGEVYIGGARSTGQPHPAIGYMLQK